MPTSEPPPDDAGFELFLTRFLRDLQDGDAASLGDYLARFPAAAEEISQLHAASQSRDRASHDETALTLSALLTGETKKLGDYRLVRILGQGGQGVVWLAEDTRLGRQVALKFLTGLGLLAPEALARFRREAEVASRLDHPGICTVYEIDQVHGIPFIAMRWVDGVSLAEALALARGPQESGGSAPTLGGDSPRETETRAKAAPSSSTPVTRQEIENSLAMIESVARTVHAAHEAGVVHRDLKPANVMVARSGPPVVLDFGLARRLDTDATGITRSGQVFGTPAYMAPEQVDPSRGAIDARTDVYALGVTLFECLTLERPFVAPTLEATYREILERPAPDPRRLNPSIPRDLAVVILTALEKDPTHRYLDAQAFAEDLRRVREHLPISARPAGPVLRLRRWVQRNPVIFASLAAVIIMLSVALVITLDSLEEARRSEVRAREQSTRATENAAAARAQERLAREESRRARANLGLAREAVDRFLTRVGNKSFQHLPRMGALRRELLEEALTFYRSFAAQAADDPLLQLEYARTRVKLAAIQEWLGDLEGAEATARAACTLLERLPASDDAADSPAHDLGEAYALLGLLYGRQSRLEDSREALERARSSLRSVLERAPDRADTRSRLAAVIENLAHCRQLAGAVAESDRLHDEALRRRERLAEENPDSLEAQIALVAALVSQASALTNSGRGESARPVYTRALTRCEALLESHPDSVPLRERRAALHFDLALLQSERDPAGAAEGVREAIALYERLRRDFPGATEYRRLESDAWAALGVDLARAGQPAEAEEAFARARSFREALVAEFPNDPEHVYGLAMHRTNDALRAARAGDIDGAQAGYEAALALFEPLTERHPDRPGFRSRLARTQHDLAWLLRDSGRRAEALVLWRKAIAAQRPLKTRQKGQEDLFLYWWNLLYTLGQDDDPEALLGAISEMREEFEAITHWRFPLLAARIAATSVPRTKEASWRGRLVTRAFRELDEAATRGCTQVKLLGEDGPFAALRKDPRWAEVSRRIEGNAAEAGR